MQKETMFLDQGAFTVEDHAQLKNSLSNRERIITIRNHNSIHTTLIISIPNVMVGNQITASDVDQMIASSQIFQNRTLRIRKFTGTRKILRLVHTYQQKYIRHCKIVDTKRGTEDIHVYGIYVYQLR